MRVSQCFPLRRLALALVAACAGLSAPGWAADLYVPGDAATIQGALQLADPGDRILVAPGVYAESLSWGGKDVVVESLEGPEQTVLDAGLRRALVIGPGGGLVGFRVENASYVSGAVVVFGAGTRIEGNVFDGTRPGGSGWAVFWMVAASPEIEGNVFTGYRCSTLANSGVLSLANDSMPRIRNNLFHANACRAVNVASPYRVAPLVVNNTFVANDVAVRVDRRQPAADQIFRNNVVHRNGIGLEVDYGAAADNPTWEHNLVFGNVLDYEGDSEPESDAGNLSLDPLLMDVDAGNFHLSPDSPAIDAGMDGAAPPTDFDGTVRPLDGDGDGLAAVDIGAFEAPELAPETLAMTLDIKPGSEKNPIRCGGRGVVPVALLGSDTVDVLEVEPDSLAFGPSGAPLAHRNGPHYKDVDADGLLDLVGHFRTRDTGIAAGDEEACLVGTLAGAPFVACDRVWTKERGSKRRGGKKPRG